MNEVIHFSLHTEDGLDGHHRLQKFPDHKVGLLNLTAHCFVRNSSQDALLKIAEKALNETGRTDIDQRSMKLALQICTQRAYYSEIFKKGFSQSPSFVLPPPALTPTNGDNIFVRYQTDEEIFHTQWPIRIDQLANGIAEATVAFENGYELDLHTYPTKDCRFQVRLKAIRSNARKLVGATLIRGISDLGQEKWTAPQILNQAVAKIAEDNHSRMSYADAFIALEYECGSARIDSLSAKLSM